MSVAPKRTSAIAVRLGLAAVALPAVLLLAGCERTFRDMYDQPRYKPLAASTLWPDGRASRSPVDGTIAYSEGTLAGTTSGRLARVAPAPAVPPVAAVRDELRPADAAATAQSLALPPLTTELLARGRERFDVFCAPCHSIAGDGDGFVARRGFPHPPSYHIDRLRQSSDAHLYAVITNGYGAMYPYARRLTPSDRLAVVAYIRALQLSQHAGVEALPPQERARLEAQR